MKQILAKVKNYGSLFDNSLEDFFRPIFIDDKNSDMKTDIVETENSYQMEIEMPGFDKENINISLENEYLTVEANKSEEQEENENNRFIKRERSTTCKRSYYVGDFKEEDVKAKYENGILNLTLTKALPEKVEAKKIAVQ